MSNEFYLAHHGILGQKWGTQNGPPYPLRGGSYSRSEKREIYKERKKKNSIYNKKHFDKVIDAGKSLSTLSYDKNRTTNTDMYFAAYDKTDKAHYMSMFNRKIHKPIVDENGDTVGTDACYKYKISNIAKTDIKVASEDSGSEAFKKLFRENRDFYNFVTDPERLGKNFVANNRFKGYREARSIMKKMKEQQDYKPTESDINTLYRAFNYTIPSDGRGNARVANDIRTQRVKFFNELKKEGYGAVLDTNDAIYGGYKSNAPVIVFDMIKVVPNDVRSTKLSDKVTSTLAYHGRKLIGK